MKAIHYIQLGLGAVVVLAQFVAGNVPQWATGAQVVAGGAGALLTALGLVTKPVGAS